MYTTSRLLELLAESGANELQCTIDTDSVFGVTNSMRCFMGRVYAIPDASNYTTTDVNKEFTIQGNDVLGVTGSGGTLTFNKAIIFMDASANERRYYYPNFANTWVQDANGDYYFDESDNAYKIANKKALAANTTYYRCTTDESIPSWRYTYAYSADATKKTSGVEAVQSDLASMNGAPSTIYGALALVNRTLGLNLANADSRDDRTVVGLMNRMKDMIANIDTQLIPNRIIKTNANGQVTTTTVPWIEPAVETENSSVAPTVQAKYVHGLLSADGTWESRFRILNVSGTSTAVTELTTNNTAVEAKALAANIDDTMTFATGNKWIRLAGDDTDNAKQITIAHALSGIAATTLSPSANGWETAGDNADNTFTLPTFGFDEAGHITSHSTISFNIPHSFKTFTIAAQSTAATNSTGNTTSVVADSLADTLEMATANKWLTIAGGDDSLTFGHITSGVTAGNYGLAADETISTLDEDNIFEVPYFTVDEAGHITAASTQTVIIPENFKTIAVAVNSNAVTALTVSNTRTEIEADSLEDTVTFASGNKWLKVASDAANDTLTFAHEIHSVTETTPTIDFNTLTSNQSSPATFTVDEVTWDEAGHLSTRAKTTYTLPAAWKNISTINTLNGTSALTASNETIAA